MYNCKMHISGQIAQTLQQVLGKDQMGTNGCRARSTTDQRMNYSDYYSNKEMEHNWKRNLEIFHKQHKNLNLGSQKSGLDR